MSEAFAAAITRRRFCELVGIHKTTLRRWEEAGIVTPRMVPILGIDTWVFEEADVELGSGIADLVRQAPGQVSLQDAARLVRAELRR